MLHDLELAEHYQKYFYTVSANTPELRKIAYQLRYKVYIEDCHFNIDSYDASEKTERDEFDDYALHALLFHKPTNQAIGNIRLIPYNSDWFDLLPLEKHVKLHINSDMDRRDILRSSNTGEISRMCLLKTFRQRRFDQIFLSGSANAVADSGCDRRFPVNYLAMCLSLMSINLLFEADLKYSVAMMENPLSTLIRHYGIQFRQVGPFTEYCGRLAPFLIYPQATYDNLLPGIRKLYKIIRAELNCDAPLENKKADRVGC